MKSRTCSRCRRRPANYLRVSSGEALCLSCLFKSIEDTVLWTIRKYGLISKGDRIGLAISGGKDSLVMTYILGKLWKSKRLPQGVFLLAFMIDEEHSYSCMRRITRIDFVRKICEEFGIEFKVYRLSEILGVSAEEVARRLWERGLDVHMCTIDGVMRRRAMNLIGRELGLTKIAVAHNIDDEAQTVMLNVMSNALDRFAWFGPSPMTEREDMIPRIKPLRFVPELETALYAYYHGIPLMEVECPFVYGNPRYMLKFELSRIERLNPNVKYAIVAFGDGIARLMSERTRGTRLTRCRYCNEPSSKDVCRLCELLEKAGLLEKYLDHLNRRRLKTVHP